MSESLGKSQKLAITNHPIIYNKNKTWHARILVHMEMAWLQYEQWSPQAWRET